MELAAGQDLLVLGIQGHSRAGGIMIGSAASAALHRSTVPVLVARRPPEGIDFPSRIVLASDGTPASDAAAELTARIAGRHGSHVAIVGARDHEAPFRPGLAEHATQIMAVTGTEPVILDAPGHLHRACRRRRPGLRRRARGHREPRPDRPPGAGKRVRADRACRAVLGARGPVGPKADGGASGAGREPRRRRGSRRAGDRHHPAGPGAPPACGGPAFVQRTVSGRQPAPRRAELDGRAADVESQPFAAHLRRRFLARPQQVRGHVTGRAVERLERGLLARVSLPGTNGPLRCSTISRSQPIAAGSSVTAASALPARWLSDSETGAGAPSSHASGAPSAPARTSTRSAADAQPRRDGGLGRPPAQPPVVAPLRQPQAGQHGALARAEPGVPGRDQRPSSWPAGRVSRRRCGRRARARSRARPRR